MSLVEDLAHQLAEAHKAGRHDVDAKPYSELDRDTAYAVQLRVMQLRGQTPGLLKTAVAPDGLGVAAPIFASRFGQSGSFTLPSANITGLELEACRARRCALLVGVPGPQGAQDPNGRAVRRDLDGGAPDVGGVEHGR